MGSATVNAKRLATAASKALPPLASISSPAKLAWGWFVTTTPLPPTASCLYVFRYLSGTGIV